MKISQNAYQAFISITQYCVKYGKKSGDLILLGRDDRDSAGLTPQEWFFAMEELSSSGDIKKRYCGSNAADFDWVVA